MQRRLCIVKLLFLDQGLEHGQALLDHLVRDTGGQAEVFGATEVIAGHKQQLILLGGFAEALGIGNGALYKEIKCAVRLYTLIAVFCKIIVKQITVFLVRFNIYLCINTSCNNLLE